MGVTPLQRCSQCILSPQSTELTFREKTLWELYKTDVSCQEHLLEAVRPKTAVAWTLTSHLKSQPRQTRHSGYCWRSKHELINNLFFCEFLHMDTLVMVDWQKLIYIYISSVHILNAIKRSCKRIKNMEWERERERESQGIMLVVVSILLYGCTTWTLTKRLEKKLDGNYTRMLWAILNKSWRQHPTRHQLYGHLPPITKTIQVRWTRHAGHCWRSRDELISDVLLWTPTYGWAKAGQPARTYIQQLCEDTGCSPEDLPEAMNDREKWRERVRDIRACGTTWWWLFDSFSTIFFV